jgi:hypothetical protein
VIGWLIAGVAGWFGLVTGIRAWVQARRARQEDTQAKRLEASLDEARDDATQRDHNRTNP